MRYEYNIYPDFENNVSFDDLKTQEDFSVLFRLEELLPMISLLDLLGIDSSKVRDLYYYHSVILKELPGHLMQYKYIPKFKKREFNKKQIIDECGQLPLFTPEDIF